MSAAPALLALLAAACWGVGMVVAKAALDGGVAPLPLAAIQLAASLAALGPAALLARRRPARPRGRAAAGALLSGALEYGATYSLFAVGLAHTSAGNAALINAAEPVFIALAAALILRERAGPGLAGRLALVTAGLALVAAPDLAGAGAPRAGDILVLASMATGAVYAVLCRRLVAAVDPLPLSLAQQAAGLALVAAALPLAAGPGWAAAGAGPLALAALSGLLQHAAAVWLHLHALRRMPAAAFALFLALVPVFALAAARVALGEAVTAAQAGGGALILAAVLGAGRLRPSARRAAATSGDPP